MLKEKFNQVKAYVRSDEAKQFAKDAINTTVTFVCITVVVAGTMAVAQGLTDIVKFNVNKDEFKADKVEKLEKEIERINAL